MIDVDIILVLKKFSPEIILRKFNIPLNNKEGKWSVLGSRGRC